MRLNAIRDYWNERAEGYSLSVKEQLSSEVKCDWDAALRKYAPQKDRLDCLDAGCGPGFLAILLAKAGHNVTAIDYSENMLEQAKLNAAAENTDIFFARMEAQNLAFPDESFDYIVSRDLTWNLEFPEKAYGEWMRVLRPGGVILIFDGNYYLHYYSDEYAREFESRKGVMNHKYMLGVDPTPINDIAKALPLSREYRPAWDISYFIGAGASNIQADIKHKNYFCGNTGKTGTVVDKFTVCVQKPC